MIALRLRHHPQLVVGAGLAIAIVKVDADLQGLLIILVHHLILAAVRSVQRRSASPLPLTPYPFSVNRQTYSLNFKNWSIQVNFCKSSSDNLDDGNLNVTTYYPQRF